MHRAVDQMAATKMSSSDSVSMKPADFLRGKKEKTLHPRPAFQMCAVQQFQSKFGFVTDHSKKKHYLGDFCLYGQKWRAERTVLSGSVLFCPVWLYNDAKRAHCQVIECNGNKAICNCTEESAAHFTHDLHQDNSFGWCNPTPPCPPSVSRSPPLSPELTHNRAAFSVSFFSNSTHHWMSSLSLKCRRRGVSGLTSHLYLKTKKFKVRSNPVLWLTNRLHLFH